MGNKYLEDLGITQHRSEEPDERQSEWDKEREVYGFDERETWGLNAAFVKWLYTRVSRYRDVAVAAINLDFHKFEIEGETLTQRQAIEKILKACRQYLLADAASFSEEKRQATSDMQKAIRIFAEIFPVMWW